MKKFGFIALAALMAVAACSKGYDDSDIQDRLDKVEAAVSNAEKSLDAYKSQIDSYKAFADAYATGSFVTKVKEIMVDGAVAGYEICFDNGRESVRIMHGEAGEPGQDGTDGHSPVLGIAQGEDGRYYWTVDGVMMTDMPASPDEDGLGIQDGETPEVSIRDGKWIISTSEGERELGPVSDSDALVSDDVFGNVEKTADDMLKVTLLNGSVMEFPLLHEYSVALTDTADPMVKKYIISGKFNAPSLNVLCPAGWTAQVTEEDGGLEGTVTLVSGGSAAPGQYTFNVLVTDGTRSATTSFTVTVTVTDNQEGGLE